MTWLQYALLVYLCSPWMVSVKASLFLRHSNTNPIMIIATSTTIIAPPAAHTAPITWGARKFKQNHYKYDVVLEKNYKHLTNFIR